MTDNETEICRIIKYETAEGTFYVPQRRVYRCRFLYWGGKWKWESFAYCKRGTGKNIFQWRFISEFEVDHFRDILCAEYHCSEWVRVCASGKVVKTWSIDNQ